MKYVVLSTPIFASLNYIFIGNMFAITSNARGYWLSVLVLERTLYLHKVLACITSPVSHSSFYLTRLIGHLLQKRKEFTGVNKLTAHFLSANRITPRFLRSYSNLAVSKPLVTWSVEDIQNWFSMSNFKQYAANFQFSICETN
jgi:hypothetical protein